MADRDSPIARHLLARVSVVCDQLSSQRAPTGSIPVI